MENIKRITEKIVIVLAIIIVAEIYLPFSFSKGYQAEGTDAAGGGGSSTTSDSSDSTTSSSSSWVEDAFGAAFDFLSEDLSVDKNSIPYKLYTGFTGLVKAANRVLLVLLAGVSIISLSIVGARYIFSGALPSQKAKAQKQLSTVFTGMLYGFGAFIIWNIAMSIIRIILKAMS